MRKPDSHQFAARRALDKALRESGVPMDTAVVMALEGRGPSGAEAFGVHSALSPTRAHEVARRALCKFFADVKLPLAPAFYPRVEVDVSPARGKYTPHVFLKRQADAKGRTLSRLEERAFIEEDSLFCSARHLERVQRWFKTPPACGSADVILALIFVDGVCLFDELSAVYTEIRRGRCFSCEKFAFVDGETEGLGIRRVWLSAISRALIAKAVHVGMEDVERALVLALERVRSIDRDPTLSLEQLLFDAKAFIALRYAGWEREWSFGRLFSRVSRPETMIRHALNVPEKSRAAEVRVLRNLGHADYHPYDDLVRLHSSRRQTTGDSNQVVLAALTKALNETPEGTNQLDHILRALLDRFLKRGLAPLTIARYWTEVRPLVNQLVDAGIEIGRHCENTVADTVYAFLDDEVLDEERDAKPSLIAATNHLLAVLHSSLRAEQVTDPARACRRYADFPSRKELERAISLSVDSTCFSSSREKADVTLVLLLLREFSLRRRELRHLRMVDFYLGSDEVWISVCNAAVGGTKTTNAQRLQSSGARDLREALEERFRVLKSLRLPKESFIFCDGSSGKVLADFETTLRKATLLLSTATGNAGAVLHRCRAMHVTELAMQWSSDAMDPLGARQAPTRLAIRSGHGHFRTTATHYLHNVELARANRQREILGYEGIEPSHHFIAAITGKKTDAVRQRLHRGARWEELFEGAISAIPTRHSLDLDSLIVSDAKQIPFASPQDEPDVRKSFEYAFLRVAGISSGGACFFCDSQKFAEGQVEYALKSNLFVRMESADQPPAVVGKLVRSDLMRKVMNSVLLGLAAIDLAALNNFRFRAADRPWLAKDVEHVVRLAPLLKTLEKAGLRIIVKIKVGRKPVDLFAHKKQLAEVGILNVDAYPPRHFEFGANCAVEFFDASKAESKQPKSRRRCMLIATSILVAAVAQLRGKNES